MNITQAAEKSGLSVDTIRFYEKSEMLPKLSRDKRGWRSFDGGAIEWLTILERLRATGMPLKDIKRFAKLVFASDTNSRKAKVERLEILQRHKLVLKKRKSELKRCEDYLDMKIGIYSKELED
jgi:MerR family transcriptional regulator, aldehyde-responsive regulator